MSVQLPNVNQPFVDSDTGLVNRSWYLALLTLNNQVIVQNVVSSVNIAGNNGITTTGGPITSSGVLTLGIGNLTCANAAIAGTVTAAQAVVTGLVDISAATAGQIQFPAAQNAAANVNTLDDYEEGTWTPTNSAGLLLTINSARYTKIGRMVFISADITYPATADATAAQIDSFPFTSANLSVGGATPGPCVVLGGVVAHAIEITNNSTSALITAAIAGGTVTNASLSTLRIYFTLSYSV